MATTEIVKDLQKLTNPQKNKFLQRFFKTKKEKYTKKNVFLNITIPEQRKMVKKYKNLKLKDLKILLKNKYHEYRLVTLLILIYQFRKTNNLILKSHIYKLYLTHTKYINNWDLVDLSAPRIVGGLS